MTSGSDFDVNGVRILCGPSTKIAEATEQADTAITYPGCLRKSPLVGQPVDVYGRWKKTHEAVAAEQIYVKWIHRDDISGYAVIDAMAGSTRAGTLEIRADGYHMVLTPKTEVSFETPLRGIGDVMTNVWVAYEADARTDGSFVLRKATFSQNRISDRESSMRTKTDYDPSAVPPDATPDRVAMAVGFGLDPKQIPPWPDQNEQARLDKIGQKLVPDWQKKLPVSDPCRINFRFQLTDGRRWPWVVALPSGIILVPQRIVDRMENDSQLAEVLADSIARVLEKQTYRMRIADAAISAGSIASWAGLVPVLGGPVALANIGTGTAQAVKIAKEQRQSARVSLDLMYDAGYDVNEAPKAWWLLNSRKPKPMQRIAMPDQSVYLYRMLAQGWRGESTGL